MRKLLYLTLCCLLAGITNTSAQSVCNAQYTWSAAPPSSSAPLGIIFNNTSTISNVNPSSPYTETRIFYGDGMSQYIGTGNNFHNYAAPGTYNTMLTVRNFDTFTNATYCSDTAYQQITVFADSSVAPCSVSITKVDNGNGSYTFTANNLSGASGITYSWYFGDGATATGSPVSHTYASNVYPYWVTLNSAGTGCYGGDSTSVYYNDSTNTGTPCAVSITKVNNGNGSYTFTANNLGGTSGLTYDWYFGDGGTATGSPVTHTYASNVLPYWVTLHSSGTGCYGGDSTSVYYNDSTSTGTPCAVSITKVNNGNGSYTFTANNLGSTSGLTYNWYFGDGGTATGSPVTHTYASNIYPYWVTLLSSGTGCYGGDSTMVYYYDSTVSVSCANLSASFATSFSGLNYWFYNTSSAANPTVYSVADWYYGDGSFTLDATTGYHTYAAGGTYNVTMINKWVDSISGQLYCTDSFTSQIVIPSSNYIRGSIYWDSSAVAGFTYPDSIKIWLIAHDSVANTLTAVDSQLVTGYYQAYQFNNKPAGDYLVKAAFLGQTPGTAGFVPTYHLSSVYWGAATTISHTGSITAGKDIVMQYGTVSSGPGFVGGNISLGAGKGTGTGIAGIQVYLRGANNVLVASAVTDAEGDFSFPNIPTGTYNVYPEAINYATTPYNTIEVTASQSRVEAIDFFQKNGEIYPKKATGIATVSKEDGLNIYPNPSKDFVIIESKNARFNKVQVVNTLGQVIESSELKTGLNKLELSRFNAGMYYLLISGPQDSRSMKIIKQ